MQIQYYPDLLALGNINTWYQNTQPQTCNKAPPAHFPVPNSQLIPNEPGVGGWCELWLHPQGISHLSQLDGAQGIAEKLYLVWLVSEKSLVFPLLPIFLLVPLPLHQLFHHLIFFLASCLPFKWLLMEQGIDFSCTFWISPLFLPFQALLFHLFSMPVSLWWNNCHQINTKMSWCP